MLNQRNFEPIVVASTDIDTVDATAEIVEKGLAQLNGKEPKAGLVYFGIETEADVLSKGLLEQWPKLQLVGCSTWGEISPEFGFTDDGIVLCLFCSDTLEFAALHLDTKKTTHAPDLAQVFHNKLSTITSIDSGTPALCLTLTDVIFFHETEALLEELHSLMPTTQFFGGGAADGMDFRQAKLMCGEQVLDTGCVFLCIFGDLRLTTILDTGWQSVGKRGTVTRAEKNVLIEVDQKPAIQFYTEGFSKPLKPVGELPVCVYDKDGDRLFIRSSYGGYDKDSGAVSFLGRIPQGSTIELATISLANMVNGVESSVKKLVSQFDSTAPPTLALFSSCAGRRSILGSKVADEITTLKPAIPKETAYLGYYTFGEICASKSGAPSVYHNQTFATLLIG